MNLNLRAIHISKEYKGTTVLKDCSYTFEDPGVYVLTGPNGSGKSTFLRMCALLEKPDTGEITYFDNAKPTPQNTALKRRITLVLPGIGLFNTSVFQNIAYGLRIRGIKGKEASERVESALNLTGLVHKKDQNARNLSSGEAQRAGIARALALEPEFLFLDEPTSSVDEKNTEMIENIIQRLKEEKRSVILMTTHDQPQALRLADFRIAMRDGMISKVE